MTCYWLESSACAGMVMTDEQDKITSAMPMWEFAIGWSVTKLLEWLKSMYNEDFRVEKLERTTDEDN